ncbi:MAG: hypothetical protein ACREV7_21430, partial [Steroidobacteraceae bacterium]
MSELPQAAAQRVVPREDGLAQLGGGCSCRGVLRRALHGNSALHSLEWTNTCCFIFYLMRSIPHHG